jgi:cell division protein FtsL
MSARLFLCWLLVLAGLVVSGIQVAFSTHKVRELHISLQTIQHDRDLAVEEYSRLQIELAAVAAYQNVERTAAEALGMAYPTQMQRVDP